MRKIYIFKEDRKGFGENLKSLMISHGFTIESLASELNYDVNTIKKWRNGSRIPSLDTLVSLAKIFDITVHELYLPNSIYNKPKSNELQQIIDGRIELTDCNALVQDELKGYCDYLFQKLLFSFITISDQQTLEKLFKNYQLTPYGVDKLGIDIQLFDIQIFCSKVKEYVNKQYGISFPYKVDEKSSVDLLKEFDKWISFSGGKALCK